MSVADDKSCPKIARCPLFERFTFEGALRVWQINYCNGEYQRCQRFQMSGRGERVEDTMLPNGKHLPKARD